MGLERFNRTVNILVTAYLNDTLQHTNCAACAVGNIIAGRNGYVHVATDMNDPYDYCGDIVWGGFAMQDSFPWMNILNAYRDKKIYTNADAQIAVRQIEATGYSIIEIDRIEGAFENGGNRYSDMDGFNGLMAVVDVLAEIDGIDLTSKEEAKLLFVKSCG